MAEPLKKRAVLKYASTRWVGIFLAIVFIAAAATSYQLGWFASQPTSFRLSLAPGQVSIEPVPNNRLKDLVVGIPVGNNSMAEARTAFAVDEKVILHGIWHRDRAMDFEGEWEWYAPDGGLAYRNTLTVKKDWVNTWNTYRGPSPMPAGDWTVVVLGALATKPRDNELRLDFTYHGISAILAMTQFHDRQEWEKRVELAGRP